MRRLCLLGGESSGKTTLARLLAAALGTAWVAEYGRQRWEEVRRTLTAAELVAVAETQIAWEDDAAQHLAPDTWLVCDTSPLTTLQYCIADHGAAPEALVALSWRHYDLVVVCAPDFDFMQDGARRDDAWRREQHDWTLARLHERGWSYVPVRGTPDERLAQVLPLLTGDPHR